MKLILALIALLPNLLYASPYDALIDQAAARYGVDPYVLRAVVQVETGKNPCSINIDGEGFKFNSAQQAYAKLYKVSHYPWMVKVQTLEGKVSREFFPNKTFAEAYLDGLVRHAKLLGKTAPKRRHDDEKGLNAGEARIRKLWALNTDIGIAQINYRFHGQNYGQVANWFNPKFNLNYAAWLIAKHKRKHRDDLVAASYYHSSTPRHRQTYLKKVVAAYQQEKLRGGYALAAN